MNDTELKEIVAGMSARLNLDQLDTKGLSLSQIQTAIDDYLAEQVRRKYRREETQRAEARKEANRKMAGQRMSIRRLLEKGGISIANSDDYRSSSSSLDHMPDSDGFYKISLNSGGWSSRRSSEKWQAEAADKRRRMIATLRNIQGLEVKIDTQVKKSEWRGEEEEYVVVSYLVRKAQEVAA